MNQVMTGLSWSLLALAFLAIFLMAKRNDYRTIIALKKALFSGHPAGAAHVNFAALQYLPPPVLRYFRRVLTDGQPVICTAQLSQRGTLRADPRSNNWLNFFALELVVPQSRGFLWDAKIRLPIGLHLRVVDAYVDGTGIGRMSFLSALRLSYQAGSPELDASALHRYLAEAVWFPTALLPEAGVQWTAIDERSARATLADHNNQVDLVFNFNDEDEVCGIVSEGRWMRVRDGYRQIRWEGHFSDYCVHDGMRVPHYGEVGWYQKDVLELVWKAQIDAASFS